MNKIIKKLFILILLVVTMNMINIYAGFHMGMISAVRDKVKKLDEKVNVIEIKGKKTISGGVFTVEPGETVKFESVEYWQLTESVSEPGQLVLENGARLIAQGLPTEPIVFQGGGIITFEEDSDGVNSIIEYCKFNAIHITANTTITIQKSKFDKSNIQLYKNNNTLIKYNNFINMDTTFINGGGAGDYEPAPFILYNNFIGSFRALKLFCVPNSIQYNNITNTEKHAIYYAGGDYLGMGPSTYTIVNCYIADCNGEVGSDTNGSQSFNINYSNPQTSPIPDAGCGW